MKRTFHTCCQCGCGNGFLISVRCEDEDGYMTISTTTSGFMALQPGVWGTIKRRIKAAWFMLRGKEYCLHDVILDKNHWNQFTKFINMVMGEDCNVYE